MSDPGRAVRFERTLLAAACLLIVWKSFVSPDRLIAANDARDSWLPYVRMLRLDWTDPLDPPLWNPHIQCGTPRVGKFMTLWYFTTTVGGLPEAPGLNLWIAVHLLIGVFGMRYWARAAGFAATPAALAALCYAMCSTWPARIHAGHLEILVGLAFGPWALGALERLAKKPGLGPALGLAAAAGVVLLFSHPMLAPALAAAGAVVAFTAASRRLFVWIAASAALAFALGAVTLLPASELMPHTHRMSNPSIWQMIPIWIHVEDFLPWLVSHPGDPRTLDWEKSTSIGVCGTMLFVTGVVAARREPRTWAMLALIAFALVLSMGPATPLYGLLLNVVPALDHMRAIPRFMVVFVWFAPLMAARGLTEPACARDGIAITAILAAIGVCITGFTQTAVVAVAAVAVGAAAVASRRAWAVALAIAAEGTLAAALWIRPVPPPETYAFNLPRDGRLYDATSTGENIPAAAGYDIARGYDPLVLNRYARLYYAVWANWDVPPADLGSFWMHVTLRRDLFDLMNIRHVITEEEIDQDGFTLLKTYPNGVRLYRNDQALPRAFGVSNATPGTRFAEADPRTTVVLPPGAPEVVRSSPPPRVDVVEQGPGRYRLRTSGPGFVVIGEAWAPGWRATVDGAPADIAPAWEALMCVTVEDGTHDVELVYSPRRFWIGLCISVVAWVGLAAVAVARRR